MYKDFYGLKSASGYFDHVIIIDDATKKENLTTADIWALRYAALRFLKANFEDYFEEGRDWWREDDSNAMEDHELYLGDFEGWSIPGDAESGDRYILRTVFMDTEGRILAHIYDGLKDSFFAVLVD